MSSNTWFRSRQSRKSARVATPLVRSLFGWTSQTTTRRDESVKGRGRSKIALTTANIMEMPPMPNASVRTTTVVNPRFFARTRQPKPKSCQSTPTDLPRSKALGAKRVNVTTSCMYIFMQLCLTESPAQRTGSASTATRCTTLGEG